MHLLWMRSYMKAWFESILTNNIDNKSLSWLKMNWILSLPSMICTQLFCIEFYLDWVLPWLSNIYAELCFDQFLSVSRFQGKVFVDRVLSRFMFILTKLNRDLVLSYLFLWGQNDIWTEFDLGHVKCEPNSIMIKFMLCLLLCVSSFIRF